MKKYIIYLGLNDGKKEKQLISTRKAIKKVTNIVCRYFGGGTISKTIGIWENKKENSLKIEIVTDKSVDLINQVATYIKRIFNQNSILIEICKNEFNFI